MQDARNRATWMAMGTHVTLRKQQHSPISFTWADSRRRDSRPARRPCRWHNNWARSCGWGRAAAKTSSPPRPRRDRFEPTAESPQRSWDPARKHSTNNLAYTPILDDIFRWACRVKVPPPLIMLLGVDVMKRQGQPGTARFAKNSALDGDPVADPSGKGFNVTPKPSQLDPGNSTTTSDCMTSEIRTLGLSSGTRYGLFYPVLYLMLKHLINDGEPGTNERWHRNARARQSLRQKQFILHDNLTCCTWNLVAHDISQYLLLQMALMSSKRLLQREKVLLRIKIMPIGLDCFHERTVVIKRKWNTFNHAHLKKAICQAAPCFQKAIKKFTNNVAAAITLTLIWRKPFLRKAWIACSHYWHISPLSLKQCLA